MNLLRPRVILNQSVGAIYSSICQETMIDNVALERYFEDCYRIPVYVLSGINGISEIDKLKACITRGVPYKLEKLRRG